jgi:PKD domain/Glycosyl hydrolase family 26
MRLLRLPSPSPGSAVGHRWPNRVVHALVLAALVGAGLCGTATATSASPVTRSTPTLAVPASGALFGAFASPTVDGSQTPSTFSSLEAAAGRQLDVDRVYADWDSPEPDPQVVWDVANGIIPLLSIDTITSTGSPVLWSQIASGSDDATIVAQAKGLASVGAPVLLAFDHEANLHTEDGTPADYVAAWQHYVTIVRRYAPNVSFVLILSHYAYDQNTISEWYPGDSYVDWVGADGYNHYNCGKHPTSWQTFKEIFSSLNSFAVAHDKPAVVAEWASVEDPNTPGRKAAWIAAAGRTMESWPQIKAASYLDAYGSQTRCDWPLTSSATAMQAFAQLGAQSYFHPRPTVALSASPPGGPAPLAVTFNTSGTAGTENPIASWTLDFGDGTSASGSGRPPPTIAHTYHGNVNTATLSVTDSAGQTNLANAYVSSVPPALTGEWGGSTSNTTAALHGGIDPNGLDTRYHLAWGTTRAVDQFSATGHVAPGVTAVQVLADLSGLTPGTTYYWHIRAANAAGASLSPLMSFETSGAAPWVSSVTATVNTLAPRSATLAGEVDPREVETQWYFEYGLTTSYGSTSPVRPGDAGSGASSIAVSTHLSGLAIGAVYHYALVAVNAAGTTVSPGHTFQTPAAPRSPG